MDIYQSAAAAEADAENLASRGRLAYREARQRALAEADREASKQAAKVLLALRVPPDEIDTLVEATKPSTVRQCMAVAETWRKMHPQAVASAVVNEQQPAAAIVNASPSPRKKSKATVNARVIDLLQRNPEARDWSARKIAESLECGKSSVAECEAYKTLDTAREMARLNRGVRPDR